MYIKGYIASLIVLGCLSSCNSEDKNVFKQLVQEWDGKVLSFPSQSVFTSLGKDTVDFFPNATYKIVSYVDSVGCMSCKLQLYKWKDFINRLQDVPVLFYMHPKKVDELQYILEKNFFDYPVCIDVNDSLNKLNHFPTEMEFQTFLLDKNNKVVAMGNPVLNPKVKELYLKIIQGKPLRDESEDKQIVTTVSLESTVLSMGDFAWQEERQGIFRLKNTGEKPLVIQDVITSCGCLTVDYPQEPVMPGKEAVLRVTYKADSPGYFNKVMTVYCNTEDAPIKLWVSGNAVK